jgi:Spy/CpxP family protein refolding chaperone
MSNFYQEKNSMFSMVLSLLPSCVSLILAIGQSLLYGGSGNEWTDSIGLNPEQIEQIKAIENSYRNAISQFEANIQTREAALTQSIISGESIENLRQKERELESLKIEAAQVYFEKFLEIRAVLTPAQILKQCEPFALTAEQQVQKFMSENPDQ